MIDAQHSYVELSSPYVRSDDIHSITAMHARDRQCPVLQLRMGSAVIYDAEVLGMSFPQPCPWRYGLCELQPMVCSMLVGTRHEQVDSAAYL